MPFKIAEGWIRLFVDRSEVKKGLADTKVDAETAAKDIAQSFKSRAKLEVQGGAGRAAVTVVRDEAAKLRVAFDAAAKSEKTLQDQITSGSPRMATGVLRLGVVYENLKKQIESAQAAGLRLAGTQVAEFNRLDSALKGHTVTVRRLTDHMREQRSELDEGGEQWLGWGNSINKALGDKAGKVQAFGAAAVAAFGSGVIAGRAINSVIGTDYEALDAFVSDTRKGGKEIQNAFDNIGASAHNLAIDLGNLRLSRLKQDIKEVISDYAGLAEKISPIVPKGFAASVRKQLGIADLFDKENTIYANPTKYDSDPLAETQREFKAREQQRLALATRLAQLDMERAKLSGNREAVHQYAFVLDELTKTELQLGGASKAAAAAIVAKDVAIRKANEAREDRSAQMQVLALQIEIAKTSGLSSEVLKLTTKYRELAIAQDRAHESSLRQQFALEDQLETTRVIAQVLSAQQAYLKDAHVGVSPDFTAYMSQLQRSIVQSARQTRATLLIEARQAASDEAAVREDRYRESLKNNQIAESEFDALMVQSHKALNDRLKAIDEEYAGDVRSILRRIVRDYGDMSEQVEGAVRSAATNMESSLSDIFLAGIEGNASRVKSAFKSMLSSILSDITQFMAKRIVLFFIEKFLSRGASSGSSGGFVSGSIAGSGAGQGLGSSSTYASRESAFSTGLISAPPLSPSLGPVNSQGNRELVQSISFQLTHDFVAGLRPLMQPSSDEIVIAVGSDALRGGKMRQIIRKVMQN